MGDPSEELTPDSYLDVVYAAAEERRNLIIVKEDSGEKNREEKTDRRRIDIWWDQESENAGLLLALGFLMNSSRHWNKSFLSVHTILTDDLGEKNVEKRILATVKKMRLGADIRIHENKESRPHWDIISETSADAAFVLLGIHSPAADSDSEKLSPQAYKDYFDGIIDHMQKLYAAAVVMAREQIDFEGLFIE
ncbi:MAG: hypothetical protein JW913_13430 [Chitinispirillaceae bacterium]|nr:hypothetical protein [Chitinispirillaceae bacterium]